MKYSFPYASKKEITFKDCCTKRTKLLAKVLRLNRELYDKWLNFIVNEYTNVAMNEQSVGRIENSTVVSLMAEAVDCLDGISILHQQGAINSAYPLIRKLMEVNFQIKFILQSDTQNKALAFEAYYVSRKTKGNDDGRNIYLKYAKYKEYKEEADRIYDSNFKGNYPEWYGVYDIVEKKNCSISQRKKFINSIKGLCENIGDSDMYDKIYNSLSKNTHGIFSRERIKLLSSINRNYICNFRDPVRITFQTVISNTIITEIYVVFCRHYGRKESIEFIKNQNRLIDAIRVAEKNYTDSIRE